MHLPFFHFELWIPAVNAVVQGQVREEDLSGLGFRTVLIFSIFLLIWNL